MCLFVRDGFPCMLTAFLAVQVMENVGSSMETVPKAEQILPFVQLGKHLHVTRGFCVNLTLLQFWVILSCES